MNELDFEALDKAVNAIIDQRQAKKHRSKKPSAPQQDPPTDDDYYSGYVGASPASPPQDDDGTTDEPVVNSVIDASSNDDVSSDDTAPSSPQRRQKRRFMDVKHAGAVRSMKIIQPLSADELTKQGMTSDRSQPKPELDYTVTSKPFFDIKPSRQKRASDVTFLIDREESTSELLAADSKHDAVDEDSYTSPSSDSLPVVTELFDDVVSPQSTPNPVDDLATEEVSVDEFKDTLESLEVKTIDTAVAPSPEKTSAAETPESVSTAEANQPIESSSAITDTAVEETPPIDHALKPQTPSNAPSPETPVVADALYEQSQEPSPAHDAPLASEQDLKISSYEPAESSPTIPSPASIDVPEPESIDTAVDQSPMQTPFIPDAKIQKRPLGAMASPDEKAPASHELRKPKSDLPLVLPSSDTAENPSPSTEALDQPAHDASADAALSSPEVEEKAPVPAEQSPVVAAELSEITDGLPAEYQSSLLELEGDSTNQEFEEPPVQIEDTAQKMVALGGQQIPRQYSEKTPEEVATVPIYETDTYHQPMTTAKKQKSGWWVIVAIFVVILLGGTGGAIVFLMQTGSL